jgi:hypothetical protein
VTDPTTTDTHSSTNQRATEPVPPTQPHDVPDSAPGTPDERADAGAGTATTPGPREGVAGAPTASPSSAATDGPPVASHVPGVQGQSPDPFGVDNAAGAAAMSPGGSSESLGDAHQVPTNASEAATGTSETAEPVDGVRVTAIAREGLADGEYDNRTPPTTTF